MRHGLRACLLHFSLAQFVNTFELLLRLLPDCFRLGALRAGIFPLLLKRLMAFFQAFYHIL